MSFREYILKMKGGAEAPPRVPIIEVFWSGLGALIGIGMCGLISSYVLEPRALTLMIGSLGASAMLVYGVVSSPFSQPRNVMGGHVISAFIGVACHRWLGVDVWLIGTIAVAVSVMAMLLTRTVHPPGGATALTAVIGGKTVHNLGFLYVAVPIALGVAVLLVVGLIVNNLSGKRRYPVYWF